MLVLTLLLGLLPLLGQFKSVFALDLPHRLLASVQVLLHFSLSLECLRSKHLEGPLDVKVVFGGCLEELHAFALSVLLGLLGLHRAVLLDVNLVSDHHERERLRHAHHRLLQERILPIGHVIEGPTVSDVIDQEGAVCTPVKGSSERLVSLLARCVPNLQRHHLPVNADFLVREVSSNRRLEVLGEPGVLEHLDQAGFADT